MRIYFKDPAEVCIYWTINCDDMFTFVRKPDCLPKWPYRFAFPPAINESSLAPHPRHHLVLSGFLILAILIGVISF